MSPSAEVMPPGMAQLLDRQEALRESLRQDIAVGMEEVYGKHTAPLDMEAIIKESEERFARASES